MIVLLDTSTPVCRLTLIIGEIRYESEWLADRQLAKGLLGYLQQQLQSHGQDFSDISGIGVMQGPGSFTGLRIGLTVMNTLADSLHVPIIGSVDDLWQSTVLFRLNDAENDQIVLPHYGSEAHITKPRK